MSDLRLLRTLDPTDGTPLPATMVGHPFGFDEAGRPLNHTGQHRGVDRGRTCSSASVNASPIPYPGTGAGERDVRIGRQADALAQVVRA